MNRFSRLRVPRALNLEMLSDGPLVARVRGSRSRQNTLKMRIRVRKVLLNRKSNSNFACKYIYIPIFLNNLCREGWGLIAEIYVLNNNM
jgi:hypothetical protein